MKLPALLPKSLQFAQKADSDQELFDLLLRNTADLVRFFAAAADDETWTEEHQDFIKITLGWLTNQFFQDRLDLEYAAQAALAIQSHYPILKNLIPYNIALKTEQSSLPANSLMLGVHSTYLRDLIIRECRDRNQRELKLAGIDDGQAAYLIRYLHAGEFQGLWKLERQQIQPLLTMAMKLRLEDLSKECQLILRRYLNRENVVDTLSEAHKMRWFYLKEASVAFFNGLGLGVHLQAIDRDHLGFEFLDFLDRSWEIFLKLCSLVTHLAARGKLTEQLKFGEAIKKCPQLISLDIAGSDIQCPFLSELPARVQELNLARSSWLNDGNFKSIVASCSHISILSLAQDTQLSFTSFGELKKMPGIKSLDLSRCQVGDAELSLIIQSCPGLNEIDLAGCRKITEQGYLELAYSLPRLTGLNVERGKVSDQVLAELAARARLLEMLNLAHCLNVTEMGVSEFLKNASRLNWLNLTDCRLPEDFIEILRSKYPKIKILD